MTASQRQQVRTGRSDRVRRTVTTRGGKNDAAIQSSSWMPQSSVSSHSNRVLAAAYAGLDSRQ